MASWGIDRWLYTAKDIFTKSYAEKQVKTYKKVIRNLNEQLKNIENYENAKECLKEDYETMASYSETAEGKLNETFEDKLEKNKEASEKIIKTIDDAIEQVKSQLQIASDKLSYWEQEAEREDKEMIVYSKEDYDK